MCYDNPMLIVIINRDEWLYALDIARRRQTENLAAKRRDAYGFDGKNGLFLHQQGCLCEYGTSKGLGIPFRETKLGDADLGDDIQVRGPLQHRHSLIVHDDEKDKDNHRFVLTTREIGTPEFHIRGWLYGHECKQQRFWRTSTGRPAFFVPQRFIRPIETLVVEACRGIKPRSLPLEEAGPAQRAGHEIGTPYPT